MRHDDISDSFNSPMKVMDGSNNVFKAYDVDKLHTPKKTEFEYNDAHSPVSAKKFIERSLHDLDDLINQRRLELSELKRSHIERLSGTREYTNPLYLQKNSTHSSPNPTSSPPVSPLSVCLCVCVCLSLCVCVCVCVSLSLCLRIPSSCIFLLLNISLHEKHCA
jgi:hypothetical protein